MKRRLGTIVLAALLVTPGLAAFQLSRPPHTGPKIGEKAPDFELVDTEGRKCKLGSYKDKIVVLEWINPDCPYVARHYRSGSRQKTYRQVREIAPGAIWLAIDSTHDANREKSRSWIQLHKLEYPILIDSTGEIGRLYDARRTPEMFVIDALGNLRFAGAIDDNQLGTKRKGEVTNLVVNAVRKIVAGEAVTPERVKPYGCSIKYRR